VTSWTTTERIVLVRHGHAGSKDRWRGPDAARPLTETGRRQAERLIDVIASAAPTRIVSSPHTRCVQTVEPLAAKLDMEVEPWPALAPEGGRDTLRLLQEADPVVSRHGLVLCTHGEVLREVLTALAGDPGLETGAPPGAKGCVWFLDLQLGRLLAATYVVPWH